MNEHLEKAELKMMTAIENLESNLATIRTGRANSQILDRVRVDYYGEPTPINQIARISVVEGTQLVIKPYDRSTVKSIAHAIQAANLGLNPQAEADQIRILVPQLTQDRRKQLAKDAQKFAEECKVAVRNVRRDCNDAIKKDKEISEDITKELLNDTQKLTDKFIKDIETIVNEKKDEILNVYFFRSILETKYFFSISFFNIQKTNFGISFKRNNRKDKHTSYAVYIL